MLRFIAEAMSTVRIGRILVRATEASLVYTLSCTDANLEEDAFCPAKSNRIIYFSPAASIPVSGKCDPGTALLEVRRPPAQEDPRAEDLNRPSTTAARTGGMDEFRCDRAF